MILAPYREDDVDEALVDPQRRRRPGPASTWPSTRASDIGNDHVWDIWRLEGPTFVWHFRGAPHVHAYVNIAKKA